MHPMRTLITHLADHGVILVDSNGNSPDNPFRQGP